MGYIKKLLQKYNHIKRKKLQHTSYQPAPQKYGKSSQDPIEDDTTARLDASGIICVHKLIGSILYYARAVGINVIMALITIANEQAKADGKTMDLIKTWIDYLATHPDATL